MTCLVVGYQADRFGHKRVLLSSMVLFIIGTICAASAPNISILEIGRFMQGAGGTAIPVISLAMIQEHYSRKEAVRLLAYLGLSSGVLASIMPIAGGWISGNLGWRWVFIMTLILITPIAMMLFKLLPGTLSPPKNILSDGWRKVHNRLIRHKSYLRYALLSPIFFCGECFYISFFPFYAQESLGLSPTAYGTIISIILVCYGLGSFTAGKLKKIPPDRVIYGAITLSHLTPILYFFLAFCESQNIWVMGIAQCCFLFSMGLIFPTSLAASLSYFTRIKATASSLRYALISLFSVFGAYSAEILPDTSLMILGAYMFATTLSALVVFRILCSHNSADKEIK